MIGEKKYDTIPESIKKNGYYLITWMPDGKYTDCEYLGDDEESLPDHELYDNQSIELLREGEWQE